MPTKMSTVAVCLVLSLCALAFGCHYSHGSVFSPPPQPTSDGFFVAGVVEHEPYHNTSLSPLQNMLLNTATFEKRAEEASRTGVQLLVYPEFALWAGAGSASRSAILPWCEPIPDVLPHNRESSSSSSASSASLTEFKVNPCTAPDGDFAASPILKRLSCIARSSALYAAFNHYEIQPCQRPQQPDCPNDGHFLWNTIVMFDPAGNLIAKYHKTNPFWTEPFDRPNQTQIATFDALGTTFGIFVCFDILHHEPAQSLLNLGIRHFAFSASIPAWASNTLFSMWSKEHKSTLIAANLSGSPQPSGIFVSGQNTASPVPDSKILVAKVAV